MVTLLSTKILAPNQRELLLNAHLSFVDFDILKIEPQELLLSQAVEDAIVTSQNAARVLVLSPKLVQESLKNTRFYTVGLKTAQILKDAGFQIVEIAKNSEQLAQTIRARFKERTFTFFCGNTRRAELPEHLHKAAIRLEEKIVYKASPQSKKFEQAFDAVLFYSPLGVSAFAKSNSIDLAVCIGSTTATEAQKHATTVITANQTTVESTIAKAVHYLKNTATQP